MIPNILLMADLHGDFKPVRELRNRNPWLQQAKARGQENILILLGDAGMNFYLNERDERFKEKLGKYPFIYFVVRGNHEQRAEILANKHPDEWHTEVFFDGVVWVENKYPYIKYAMDYVSTYLIPYDIAYVGSDGIEMPKYLHTLVIPGAYSVDKYHRLQMGWSWFPKEQLSDKEQALGLDLIESMNWKCDLVLSHTCPIIYEPTDLFIPTLDQSMIDKTMERYLGQIEYGLDYKAWCWGHYHQFRDYPRIDGHMKTMLFNDYALNLKEYMNGEIKKI